MSSALSSLISPPTCAGDAVSREAVPAATGEASIGVGAESIGVAVTGII